MSEFTEHDAVVGAGAHGHRVRPKRRSPRAVFTAAAVVAVAGLAWWAEAQETRQQTQDTACVLVANRWMSEDPTAAALVRLEVVNPDQTPYAINTMMEVLGQPLTRSVLRGHGAKVTSAVFSPDGTKVLTASFDGTARVWNVDGSGEPVVLRGHGAEVNGAVFNPDGTKVLTASDDHTARVWNLGVRPTDGSDGRTPGEPLVLRGHGDVVSSAAFNADGTKVVTAGRDGTARVWNVGVRPSDGPEGRTPGEPLVLRGHEGSVETAAFSPDATDGLVGSATGGGDRAGQGVNRRIPARTAARIRAANKAPTA